MVTVNFDKKKYTNNLVRGELKAMGRTAGAAFTAEHLVTDAQAPTSFWLMGIEFYKIVKDTPVLIKGGVMRAMVWMGATMNYDYPAGMNGIAFAGDKQ